MARRPNSIIDAMPEHSSHSVSVRKISNGYLRTESRCHGDEYSSKETFHAQNPGLGKGESRGDEGKTLKGAVDYLKGSKK